MVMFTTEAPYGRAFAWSDVKWREKVKAWWRKRRGKPRFQEVNHDAIDRLVKVQAAAKLLYDNRIGEVEYTHDRNPYAPRAFWGALGLALGEDVSWILHTARSEDDGRLTLRAAHQLLDYALAPKENKTAIDRLACDL